MKRTIYVLTCALFALPAAAKLTVVTTTQDLASIAQAVGGSNAKVTALVVGARDPHRLEAKPSFMSLLARADLYVAIGLDLEVGYEDAILQGSRNGRVQKGARGHVHAGDWCVILEKPTGPVSRGMGDIHPYGNPHVWLDPYNGRLIAAKLAEKMAGLDPGNAAAYRENAKDFSAELDKRMFGATLVSKFGADNLWSWIRSKELISTLHSKGASDQLGGWTGQMSRHVGGKIVTYHKSWIYFTNRFGFNVVDELEPKPGIDPTPSHLANVVNTVKSQGVKVILQEPFYSTRNGKFVESRTGAKVVVAPGGVGHVSEAKDYFSLFDTIISRLKVGLGG